jgi:uncharacterized protein (DUF1015 family)|tara:strand:- start:1432 stop:2688 length:1257 start_codon:yes stop_codon:yes gene_type:complete
MNKLIRPFRLVQPPRHLAHLVASRSYLSYDKAELQDKLERNPFSYLQVINPDAKRDMQASRGTEAYFREVRAEYDKFLKKGWLEGTDGVGYAIYRQTTPSKTYTGIVAAIDLPMCKGGAMKVHELTLESREELFATYLECVGFHAEPILCARKSNHQGKEDLDSSINLIVEGRPADCDFSTTDLIRHSIWWVNQEIDQDLFDALIPLDKIYLADGHHRLASSYKLMHSFPNEPGVDRILAYILPAEELSISGFHREIKSWDGNVEGLVGKIKATEYVKSVLEITETSEHLQKPGSIDLLIGEVHLRIKLDTDNLPKNSTDAGWLSEYVLKNILSIANPRNHPDLRYIPGSISREALILRAADNKDSLIFALHPMSIDEITDVADAGGSLPPKSTWVEPKLRSGLFTYEFGNHPHPEGE